MLAYTDSYVTRRLIDFMEGEKLNETLFERLLRDAANFDNINERLQAKTDVNFLVGYINWDIVSTLEQADPIGLCYDLYDACLYQEYDIESSDSPIIEFTKLSDTIKSITKDNNTESVYVYMKYPCEYLQSKIETFFRSSKVHIVSGDKEDFLKNHTFDSYFFENIDDIEYIKRWHSERSEVIIPAFPFNVSGYDVTKDMEVIYSQDSLFKLPILEENPIEYLKNYNLDLALIDIPL